MFNRLDVMVKFVEGSRWCTRGCRANPLRRKPVNTSTTCKITPDPRRVQATVAPVSPAGSTHNCGTGTVLRLCNLCHWPNSKEQVFCLNWCSGCDVGIEPSQVNWPVEMVVRQHREHHVWPQSHSEPSLQKELVVSPPISPTHMTARGEAVFNDRVSNTKGRCYTGTWWATIGHRLNAWLRKFDTKSKIKWAYAAFRPPVSGDHFDSTDNSKLFFLFL